MNRRPHLAPVVCCMLLTSCGLTNQRVDFSWFKDTFTPPEKDTVYVEEGRGLPESEAPALATAGATPAAGIAVPAPQPQPTAPAPVAAAPVAAVAAAPRTHTVVKGDTLAAIARRYNSSVPAICAANGIQNPRALRLGAVLRIPAATRSTRAVAAAPPAAPKRSFWQFWKKSTPPPAPQARYHTVQRGDTLNAIAHRYGVSPAALINANRMTREQANRLRIGQRLVIPSVKR